MLAFVSTVLSAALVYSIVAIVADPHAYNRARRHVRRALDSMRASAVIGVGRLSSATGGHNSVTFVVDKRHAAAVRSFVEAQRSTTSDVASGPNGVTFVVDPKHAEAINRWILAQKAPDKADKADVAK